MGWPHALVGAHLGSPAWCRGTDAAAEQPDPKRFAAQALALRTAAIERQRRGHKNSGSMIPGSAPVDVLPGLWHSFFENAIVKLGRLRAPVPVALYYNPLLDIARHHFLGTERRALSGRRDPSAPRVNAWRLPRPPSPTNRPG